MSYVSPIPTKPISSSIIQAHLRGNEVYKIPSLEVLVDMCYRFKTRLEMNEISNHVDHKNWNSDKLLAFQFMSYCELLHCQESFNFLIEIFKYEQLYDSIFPNNDNLRLNTPSPKPAKELVNTSIHMQYSNFARTHKPPSIMSIRSNETKDSIVSCTNALPGDSITNIWDDLMEKELRDESDSDDSDSDIFNTMQDINAPDDDYVSEDENNLDQVNPKKLAKLNNQWNLIVKRYILEDAPEQINLSNDVYIEITRENTTTLNDSIHSPNVLWRAKNEVLQLIKENVYMTFVSISQKREVIDRCTALGLSCCSVKSDINYVESPYMSGKSSPSASRNSPLFTDINSSTIHTSDTKSHTSIIPPGNNNNDNTNTNNNNNKNNNDDDDNNNNTNNNNNNNNIALTPVQSTGHKKKSIFRNFTSPSSTPTSASSSPLSISAFWGHWKIPGTSQSVSTSPNSLHEAPTKSKKGRFWKYMK